MAVSVGSGVGEVLAAGAAAAGVAVSAAAAALVVFVAAPAAAGVSAAAGAAAPVVFVAEAAGAAAGSVVPPQAVRSADRIMTIRVNMLILRFTGFSFRFLMLSSMVLRLSFCLGLFPVSY